MLQKGHLKNCFENYQKLNKPLPAGFYLGYMEACLVQFGVIESKNNGLVDYALNTKRKFLFWEWQVSEGRASIIIRLVKEFLER